MFSSRPDGPAAPSAEATPASLEGAGSSAGDLEPLGKALGCPCVGSSAASTRGRGYAARFFLAVRSIQSAKAVDELVDELRFVGLRRVRPLRVGMNRSIKWTDRPLSQRFC